MAKKPQPSTLNLQLQALPLHVHALMQGCPGHGASLNPAEYLEALLALLLKQQQQDYKQLHGSRGMHK